MIKIEFLVSYIQIIIIIIDHIIFDECLVCLLVRI